MLSVLCSTRCTELVLQHKCPAVTCWAGMQMHLGWRLLAGLESRCVPVAAVHAL